MIFDAEEIRSKIKRPISDDILEGDDFSSDSLYEFIEEEMMKVGSLSHGSVKWDKVEENLIILLNEKTKDIILIDYFIECCKRRNNIVSFYLALSVISDFVSFYWSLCYPKKEGAAGKRYKIRVLDKIFKKIDLFIDSKMDLDCELSFFDEIFKVNDELKDSLSLNEIFSEQADLLYKRIKSKFSDEKSRAELDAKSDVKEVSQEKKDDVIKYNNSASSEKESRKKISEVIDIVKHGDEYASLALRLKRFNLWSSIKSLPDSNKNKTLIQALPKERIAEYFSLLENPTYELWERVESTIVMAPFWIDGQYLSFLISDSLGLHEISETVFSETKRFIGKFPQIYDLTFKDGTPFVSEDCADWLTAKSNDVSSSLISNSEELDSIKVEANEVFLERGLQEALKYLDVKISEASCQKDIYQLRLISSEMLKESGAADIASQQFEFMFKQVSEMRVSEWDPIFLKRLKNSISFD